MEQEKTNLYKWVKISLILLTVFLAVTTVGALKKLSYSDPAYNSLSVTGEGEVVAIPDVATFSFSVSADAKTVAEAQSSVTDKMDAILAALKAQGLEDRDIKTTNYNVYPKTHWEQVACTTTYCPPGKQVNDGYTASHDVTVKVRKTDNAGAVLGVVGDKGATNISGITFTQDDPDATTEAAREAAIKDARDKAKTLAKSLGVRLVRVISYYDNSGGYPVPMYGEAMGGDMVRTMSAKAPTIPQGENKTTVSVTVVYEIR